MDCTLGLIEGLGAGRRVCSGAVVGGLVFDGWDQADLSVEAPMVVPVDPFDHRDLEVVDRAPGAAIADEFALEQGCLLYTSPSPRD